MLNCLSILEVDMSSSKIGSGKKKTLPICSEENVCPHCGCGSHHKEIDTTEMELCLYRIKDCGNCGKRFVVPYLLCFDEDRPEDQMEYEI